MAKNTLFHRKKRPSGDVRQEANRTILRRTTGVMIVAALLFVPLAATLFS